MCPVATQFFILPLLFPYELGLFFSPLSPNPSHTDMASTAVTAAELYTTEVVLDGEAHGTPKESCKEPAWLQGCRLA